MTVTAMEACVTTATKKAKLVEHLTTGELANLDFLRTVAVGLVFVGHLLATMRIRGGGATLGISASFYSLFIRHWSS